LFNDFLQSNFPDSLPVFTDGSVPSNSAGFSFFLPTLNISFADKLNSFSSSFTAECYAIISALEFVFSLENNIILIVTDSQSCLFAISSNPFNSSLSPLVLLIKSLIYCLSLINKTVQFLWVPSHVGILGNERADHLAFFTKGFSHISLCKIPALDLLPFLRKLLHNSWESKWSSLPSNYASWHRSICPSIPLHPWFLGLEIPKFYINSFSRLRIGHSLLPHHSYHLSLNSSPLCPLHLEEAFCDFNHIIFNCPSLLSDRHRLFSRLSSLGFLPSNAFLILNSRSPSFIQLIINFILNAGFLI